MAGFAERGDRRFVVVAMVEHGLHGASGAGPVVKTMIDALFLGKKELPPKDTAGVEGPASPAARQAPNKASDPGTRMRAQMILLRCCWTHGRLPKK